MLAEGAQEFVAYHGSAERIDRFDLSRVGSGVAGNTQGWGVYFAGRKESADTFRRILVDKKSSGIIAQARALFKAPDEGHVYTVRFDCGREDFLDAGKPHDQQGKWNGLCAELAKLPPCAKGIEDFYERSGQPTQILYARLAQELGGRKQASLELARRGVKGISVNGSGGEVDPYHIVFDDKVISIIEHKDVSRDIRQAWAEAEETRKQVGTVPAALGDSREEGARALASLSRGPAGSPMMLPARGLGR